MAAAANLTEAAELAMTNAFVQFAGANTLRSRLALWFAAFAGELDPESRDQRTVLNWVPVGRPLESRLPTVKGDEIITDADAVGVFLYRTCRAAEFAENDGRITGAQATALVNAYNATWA